MESPKKLSSRQQTAQEQETVTGQTSQTQSGQEFSSVEQMLRHDALHTPVPPSIARRLQESVDKEGLTVAPWWRRFFSGKGE